MGAEPRGPAAITLKRLADALDVSNDYLPEGSSEEAAKARFEDRELLRQFQEVEHLSEEDKTAIKKLLDAGCLLDQETPANPGTLR